MLLTLLAASWFVLCAVAVLLLAYRPGRRLALRQRVLVNLIDGKALHGVLWARRGGYLVLKDATLHVPGAEFPAPMQGEVLVERDRVDFVQISGG